MTALGNAAKRWDDERLALYRAGREQLLSQGYQQVSMRMFRRPSSPEPTLAPYHCQEDGMVGLGCGARSYTRRLHYSQDWAVGSPKVRGIIEAYLGRSEADFARAHHGFVLDLEEETRRDAVLSILADGLDLERWRARFGSDPVVELAELGALLDFGLIERVASVLRLTEKGLERSDAIGPFLHSARVDALMEAWERR
jgi:oxygen-independent coproporphyrinogen-3 oxidase